MGAGRSTHARFWCRHCMTVLPLARAVPSSRCRHIPREGCCSPGVRAGPQQGHGAWHFQNIISTHTSVRYCLLSAWRVATVAAPRALYGSLSMHIFEYISSN
eukprot:scaffold676_cov115-Isochrysis_galbana.AAC.17